MDCSHSTKNRTLDVKGLDCPLPILRTKLALADMACGEVLEVWCTDPHAEIDFRAFCAQPGRSLLHHQIDADQLTFVIRKD